MMRIKLSYFFLFILVCSNVFAQQDTVITETVQDEYDQPYEEGTIVEEKEGRFLQVSGRPDSLVLREIPDSLVKQMKNDRDFWYADANFPKEPKTGSLSKPLFMQAWFQTLLWVIIIAGFAGFLVWYLAGNNVGLFKKKRREIEEPSLEEELSTDDLFAINYQREIDKALGQGNYRLGVRLMFLRLLKTLSEKKIIDYRQGKTNFDYLMQLQSTGYYPDFFRATRNYEYSWYGLFEIGQENFSLIKKEFDQLEKKLDRE